MHGQSAESLPDARAPRIILDEEAADAVALALKSELGIRRAR